MKIDLIGHASLLVETEDCQVLMDPVFFDPFCEGLNESCPKRTVFPEKIPDFDFLVISHQHLDHFDIRTLASLPKNVDVLIPQDKLIAESLVQLGYKSIYPLREFDKVRIGSTVLMTTRSEVRVPEFGMVFADSSGVFWNTVDTYFAPPTIQRVKKDYPHIDFLLSVWHISMEGKYQYNQSLSFPFGLYGELFHLISLIQPSAIAPGANGFKYINQSSWQNRIVFPVTRERFCRDLETAFPELKKNIYTLDPGDVFTIDQGKYSYNRGQSEYAQMILDDWECLEFSPVNVEKNLLDGNPENYDLSKMKSHIAEEIEINLLNFITEYKDLIFKEHCRWSVIYQLEVIFPDGSQKWFIDFSQDKIKVEEGRNAIANLFSYITASSLFSLIEKKRDWDYLLCSGEYRTFQKVYAINKLGIIPADASLLKDPLELRLSSQYIQGNNIKLEIEKWGNTSQDNLDTEEDINPMLRIGNLLIKKRNLKKSEN